MSEIKLVLGSVWIDALARMPADRIRVAWALLMKCVKAHGPIVTSRREIAAELEVSRRQVDEAVQTLRDAGAIVEAFDGARGATTIDVRAVETQRGGLALVLVDDGGPVKKRASKRDNRANETPGLVERATPDPAPGPPIGPPLTDEESLPGGPAIGPAIGPPPIMRSQRSTTGNPQAQTADRATEDASELRALRDSGAAPLTEPRDVAHPDPRSSSAAAPDPAPLSGATAKRTGDSEATPSGPGAPGKGSGKRRSVRALKLAELPPIAVALADRFRPFVLIEQPWHAARKAAPWDGSALRLRWAQDFAKLLAERTDGPLDAPRFADQVERMLVWLAGDQGCTEARYRIIVLSTDALREKWDRIVARAIPRRAPTAAPTSAAGHAATTRKLATAPARFDPDAERR